MSAPSASPPAATPAPPPPSSNSSSSSPPPPPPRSSSSPPPPSSSPPPPSSSPPPPPPSSSSSPPPPSSAPPPTSPPNSPPPPPVPAPVPSSAPLPPPPPPTSVSNPPPSTTSTTPSPPPPKSTSPSPPPPPPASSSSSSSISSTLVIGIVIGGALAISIFALLLYCLCCRKSNRKQPKKNSAQLRQEIYASAAGGLPPGGLPAHALYKDSYSSDVRSEWTPSSGSHAAAAASDGIPKKPPPPPLPPASPPCKKEHNAVAISKYSFAYEELEAATDGFSISNKLGEGGFGCVYKGTIASGQLVAVKQLKVGASQGEKEFQAEVEIISRVHHRHLVSLVGYCISEHQRLLVYDYVPNGTLEYHLHHRMGGPVLDWSTRLKIACGAARGLAYLHEDCHPRIIHRDIKSSNILLDDKFEAQVSDFGLAKLTSDTDTHVTTRVMGTFGYLAPEYASSGKLTEKSDVFSFGVVLLELLTGRKPVDASQPLGRESLVELARPVLNQINGEGQLEMIADPALNGDYDPKEMLRMVEAAAACVRHAASKRPRMGQVVRALEDEISLSDLNKGLRSGQGSRDYDYENGESYSIEMGKLRRLALESQDFQSDYSGTTSGEHKEDQRHATMSSTEYDQTMSSQETKPSTSGAVSSSISEEGTTLDQYQQPRPPRPMSVRKKVAQPSKSTLVE